jgi:hypothetical protein
LKNLIKQKYQIQDLVTSDICFVMCPIPWVCGLLRPVKQVKFLEDGYGAERAKHKSAGLQQSWWITETYLTKSPFFLKDVA